MSHSRIIVATLLTISSVFCVNGQTTSTTACQSVQGMNNINGSLFKGTWYEEFRYPAQNISCVLINVKAVNQTQLNVTVLYSASKNGLLMDNSASAVVDLNAMNSNAFNVTYNNDTVTTFKILSTDYTSNAVLCGYTNLSDLSTSFGLIATREQIVNRTWLMELKNNASQILPSFNDSLAGNITQSLQCKTNSAASPVPAYATLFAAFYALVKFAH